MLYSSQHMSPQSQARMPCTIKKLQKLRIVNGLQCKQPYLNNSWVNIGPTIIMGDSGMCHHVFLTDIV